MLGNSVHIPGLLKTTETTTKVPAPDPPPRTRTCCRPTTKIATPPPAATFTRTQLGSTTESDDDEFYKLFSSPGMNSVDVTPLKETPLEETPRRSPRTSVTPLEDDKTKSPKKKLPTRNNTNTNTKRKQKEVKEPSTEEQPEKIPRTEKDIQETSTNENPTQGNNTTTEPSTKEQPKQTRSDRDLTKKRKDTKQREAKLVTKLCTGGCTLNMCEDKRYANPGERLCGAKCYRCSVPLIDELKANKTVFYCTLFDMDKEHIDNPCPNAVYMNCNMPKERASCRRK